MSNSIYPTLPGLVFDVTRTPVWSTTTKVATSLRSYRNANASYPLYRYKLSYEILRQTLGYSEMATLAGFFNARQGGFDSFLFLDPDDSYVAAQAIGTGDGSTTKFQLVRTFGGYVEPVFDWFSQSIFDNGAAAGAYSVSASGLVTFTTAPLAGHAITWTGVYYRRVVFAQDTAEFTKFMQALWSLKTVSIESAKP